jgi:PAS domain S-box-containing protein
MTRLQTSSVAARVLGIASASGAVIATLARLTPVPTGIALLCASLAVLVPDVRARRMLSLATLVSSLVGYAFMPLLGGIAAILAGAAGLILERRMAAQVLAIASGFIGIFGVVAWAYGAVVPIRPAGALLFVIWSLALLARTAGDARWALAMRVSAVSVIVPIALCGLALASARAGHIGMPLAVALSATITGLVLVLSALHLMHRALASEMMYRTIVETSQEGICTIENDGVLTFVNDRLASMLGYEPRELIGRRASELMTGFDATQTRSEVRLACANGTFVDAIASQSRMPDTGTLVLLSDITARKRAETALRVSEARFRSLFDTNIVGVCFGSSDGRISDANDLFLGTFGITREALPQWSWRTQNIEEETLAALAENGRVDPHIRQCVRTDGSTFHAIVAVATIEEAPDANITFVLDITERVETRNALERAHAILAERVIALEGADAVSRENIEQLAARLATANTELETFSYSVSHDLRTPLRAIDGFSRELVTEWGERLDGTARNYLGRIRAATGRMSRLIDDLLNLSRLGRTSVRRENVDVSTLAADVARERGATHVRIEPGLTANADPNLLRIVLDNLIGNAIKFSARSPEPLIEVFRAGDDTFAVRDNGTGFDMAYVDKVFAPFQRLHSSEFEGTGIGLALVQRIVARHGGAIRAASTPGQGATFFVSLREPAL